MIEPIPNSGGFEDIDRWLTEFNTCHGSDGKFCSGAGAGATAAKGHAMATSRGMRIANMAAQAGARYGTEGMRIATGKATAGTVAGVRAVGGKATAASVAGVRRQNLDYRQPDAFGFSQGKPAAARKEIHKQLDADEKKYGPTYDSHHRGIEIHTLPGYITPYYYAKHPALGSFNHSPSLRRIKNQINDLLDKKLTPKRKASQRYYARKARYGRG